MKIMTAGFLGTLAVLLSGCVQSFPPSGGSPPLHVDRAALRSSSVLSADKGQLTFVVKEGGRKIAGNRLESVHTEVKTEDGVTVMEGINVTDIIVSGPRVRPDPVVRILLERTEDGKLMMMMEKRKTYSQKVTLVHPGHRYWISVLATSRDPDDDQVREARSKPCLISVK